MKIIFTWFVLTFLSISAIDASPKVSTTLIISQIYGDGGTTGSTYANDFIEIYNRGSVAINLSNYSVQYSTGTSWVITPLTAVILQPSTYYLIKEASNGSGGISLPYADATGSISLHANNGKVALVNSTTQLPNGCSSPLIVDLVGYGNVNCFEGAPATGGNNILSIIRTSSNIDTDNNSNDFTTSTPNPRTAAFTLPIIINNFYSHKRDNENELQWQVNCLTSSVSFELERSSNIKKFETIYSETATRARCAVPFIYIDINPLAGTNSYRLKIINVDNSISYSKIVTVNNNNNREKRLSVNPTIVNSGASLKYISNIPQNISWIITDMQGRQMKKFTASVIAGENNIPLKTNHLPAGQYNIKGYSKSGEADVANFIKK